MKKIFLMIVVALTNCYIYAQSNIHESGNNVGIGTASPVEALTIANSSPNALGVYRNLDVTSVGSAGVFINFGARNGNELVSGAQITGVLDNPASSGWMAFSTLNSGTISEKMRITKDGNIGIGTTTPSEKLDVHGNIVWNGNSSGNPRALKIGYSGGNYGGIGYNIDFTGSTGVFNRPLADYSSYLDFFLGGYRFFGTNNHSAANGINLNGTDQNLKLLAVLTNEGYMGIGTTTPLQNFVVSNNGSEGFKIYLRQPAGVVGLQSFNRASSTYSKMHFDASSFSFGIGDVGIGTTDTRGYKLAVNGKIRTQEIKVETANWPDYVFSKSYTLPSLEETEKHIKEKGHLPGIPSAEDVKANGIDLGEMNAKLLQKIEELTLHLINESKLNAEKQNALLQKLEKINHDNKRLKMENSEIKRRQAYIVNKFKNFNKAQK